MMKTLMRAGTPVALLATLLAFHFFASEDAGALSEDLALPFACNTQLYASTYDGHGAAGNLALDTDGGFATDLWVGGIWDGAATEGRDVLAMASGTVWALSPGYGGVAIEHGTDGNGRTVRTYLGHLSGITVEVGDQVQQGTKVGVAGDVGAHLDDLNNSHVHMEIQVGGQTVDPSFLIRTWEGAVSSNRCPGGQAGPLAAPPNTLPTVAPADRPNAAIEGPGDDVAVVRRSAGSLSWFFETDGDRGSDDSIERWGNTNDTEIVGDWDGDGTDEIGLVRLDADGRYTWFFDSDGRAGTDRTLPKFGRVFDRPLVGDWNGDGRDDVGVLRHLPDGRLSWFFDHDRRPGTDRLIAGWGRGSAADITPLVGDWNGDGRDDVGFVMRRSDGWYNWYFDHDGKRGLDHSIRKWGASGDEPIVGDWNGNGRSNVGLYRAPRSGVGGVWFFDLDQRRGTDDSISRWGEAGDEPLVGDWNGDGRDDVAAVRLSDNRWTWFFDTDRERGSEHTISRWGERGRDRPLVGNF